MAGWRKSRKWDRGTQERQEQGLRQLKKEGTLKAGIRICACVKWYFRGIGDIAILQSWN